MSETAKVFEERQSAAGKAVRDAIEMALELDMVIDADPANAPFGKAIGLRRQRLEVRPVELFERRPAGDTEPPDRAFVVELPQQLAELTPSRSFDHEHRIR